MPIRSTTPLPGLFRRSPFTPLQEHMRTVFSCICLIPTLFHALYLREDEQIADLAAQIDSLETEADKIKSNFRLNMPNSLFMPVARRDLLELLNDQDSLADIAEHIAQIVVSRDMVVPEAIKSHLDALLEETMEATSAALKIIEELDELLEVGFGGREREKVSGMIDGVRKCENNIDKILHNTRRSLFAVEDELDPVSVMYWYKIIELVGDLSDQSENIADRLLLFLSK
ncbi:TIGR00153 family protein [Desulfobulbus rhabdoformis]|uniref:TIGR00153 family protein n=1 Tax=Desulfobulbus rhabdoformis TaxID=34032 RepID=UPI00196698A6|nr:TIGR00153 family protein [Desulfobulbus rhabdoformis]MBM9615988.1 TIGR00153 family protein [Desulfobulbus rhabdoformis]